MQRVAFVCPSCATEVIVSLAPTQQDTPADDRWLELLARAWVLGQDHGWVSEGLLRRRLRVDKETAERLVRIVTAAGFAPPPRQAPSGVPWQPRQHERTCQQCGVKFSGTLRHRFCAECRALRDRETYRRAKQRARAGLTKPRRREEAARKRYSNGHAAVPLWKRHIARTCEQCGQGFTGTPQHRFCAKCMIMRRNAAAREAWASRLLQPPS